MRRPTQAAFAFIFITVAIDMLGFGMAAPVHMLVGSWRGRWSPLRACVP